MTKSQEPIFSPWILTPNHAPNAMTIMYEPYRHRRHVRAFDHANIGVNTRPGIQRNCLHILYLAGKSPQTTGPSPMDSPDIKEQMLQRKIKVRRSRFFTHLIIVEGKVLRTPDLHQCTLPRSNNRYYKEKQSPKIPIIYAFYNHRTERAQNAAPSPTYSPCQIEEIWKNHQVRTYALSKSGQTSPQTPAPSPTYFLDMTAPKSMQKDRVRTRN